MHVTLVHIFNGWISFKCSVKVHLKIVVVSCREGSWVVFSATAYKAMSVDVGHFVPVTSYPNCGTQVTSYPSHFVPQLSDSESDRSDRPSFAFMWGRTKYRQLTIPHDNSRQHGIIFQEKSFTIACCKPCKLFVNLWIFFFFSEPKGSNGFKNVWKIKQILLQFIKKGPWFQFSMLWPNFLYLVKAVCLLFYSIFSFSPTQHLNANHQERYLKNWKSYYVG